MQALASTSVGPFVILWRCTRPHTLSKAPPRPGGIALQWQRRPQRPCCPLPSPRFRLTLISVTQAHTSPWRVTFSLEQEVPSCQASSGEPCAWPRNAHPATPLSPCKITHTPLPPPSMTGMTPGLCLWSRRRRSCHTQAAVWLNASLNPSSRRPSLYSSERPLTAQRCAG